MGKLFTTLFFYREEDSGEEAISSNTKSNTKNTEESLAAGIDEYNFQAYDDESKKKNEKILTCTYN